MYDHSPDAETATSAAAPDRMDRADRPAPPVRAPAVRPTDGERLMRFRLHRDDAAFREVVEAHAVLVWGVCWQVLRHREDVEDAFQATFLILARKGAAIRASDSAAGWLYRVAFRTALAARARRRRLGAEPLAVDPPASLEEQFASIERAEQVEALLEELHALGDRYRQPLVLCYLEGRSRQEAADELGVTLQSVKGRLARGLRLLRTRLAHRGMALSGAATVLASEMATAQASVGAAAIAEVAATAASFACTAPAIKGSATKAAAAAVAESSTTTSPGALLLAKQGIIAMKFAAIVKPAIGLLAVGATAGALALAAADSTSGNGDARTSTVVELVDGDGGDVDSPAQALAPNTFVATPEVVSTADAPVASADGFNNGTLGSQTSSAQAATDAPPVATSSPRPTAAGWEPPVQPPADVLTTAPAAVAPSVPGYYPATSAPVVAPTHAPQVYPFPSPYAPPALASQTTAASRAAMQLEKEHWTLKASGLKKKAEALGKKLAGLAENAAIGPVEKLEMEAEIELTQAEVKLCEARAAQMSESIDAARGDARFAPPTMGAPLTPSAAIAPAPILQANLAATTLIAKSNSPLKLPSKPLGIHLPASPTPDRVGSRVVWEFRVVNQTSLTDENVELRVPTPDFLTVDLAAIDAPPQVQARMESDHLVFTPVPSLPSGEMLRYRIPFTSRRPGSAVLKGIAASKHTPQGVWIGAGIAVAENAETQPAVAPLTANFPIVVPSTPLMPATSSPPTSPAQAMPTRNEPGTVAETHPLRIQLVTRPARVGSPSVWEFMILNLSDETEENVELRIPTPDFIGVDPKAIATPTDVSARVENNVIIFSPVAKLRRGERALYSIPFTSRRAGTFVLEANAISKGNPKGPKVVAAILISGEDKPLASAQSQSWSSDGVARRFEDVQTTTVGLPIAAAPFERSAGHSELNDLVSKLQKANAALERRLEELERSQNPQSTTVRRDQQ